MAILSDIADEIAVLISGLTIANGYDYDANIDENILDHAGPTYDIEYADSDTAAENEAHAQWGFSNALLKIIIRGKNTTYSEDPDSAIDSILDDYLSDLKALLGPNGGQLALSNANAVITYKNSDKKPGPSQDAVAPKYIESYWNVFYQNT
jgi:hypothetical protein